MIANKTSRRRVIYEIPYTKLLFNTGEIFYVLQTLLCFKVEVVIYC